MPSQQIEVPAVQQSQQSEPRLLTIPEAAKYLSSTVWAVRSLIWDHKIPYVPLGKKQLIDRTDLDEYVDSIKVDKRKANYGKRVQ